MSDVAIRVEDLGKQYRLGEIGTGTITHDLNRWWAKLRGKEDPFAMIGETNDRTKKGSSDYVWSLRDVSFDVKQGEVLGIIGRNGAGKSTLLKLLSKVTAPTTGRIKIKGRIASLLEVGTGFHPELTGRENVFLNGAILGMTKEEIRGKFDEIVDFSGVERYIDTPVKRYSSGMYVRLAFAVAAFLEPEILIVDEVLAVGDAEFQKKCLGRMEDVSRNDGRTILFVSHSMAAVKNICTAGLVLKNGQISSTGGAGEIVDYYVKNFINVNDDTVVKITNEHRAGGQLSRLIEYVQLEFVNPVDNNFYAASEDIEILVTFKGNVDRDAFRLAFTINRLDETKVGTFFSDEVLSIRKGQTKQVKVTIRNHQLSKGEYYIDLSVGTGSEVLGITDYDVVMKTLFFCIVYKDVEKTQMITLWDSAWGYTNFQNVELKQLQ